MALAMLLGGFGMKRIGVCRYCVAGTAAVVAAAMVIPAPNQLKVHAARQQVHEVQLQALAADFALSAALPGGELLVSGAQAAVQSIAGEGTDQRTAASAAATGTPNLLSAIATIGLGAVLLPMWYLAFPVTLPSMILFVAALTPADGNPIANIVIPGLQYWLTTPIQRFFEALKAALSPSVAAAVRTSSVRAVAADIPDLDAAAAEWPKLSVAKAERRSAARAASGPVKTVRAASAVPSRRLAGAASTSVSRVVDGAAGRIRSAQRTATPAENTTRHGDSSGAQPI